MANELKKKLPEGVVVIFFENVGWLHADGDFTSSSVVGCLAVGYVYSKELIKPGEKAIREHLKKSKDFVALHLRLTTLSKEVTTFFLFGTSQELETIQKAIKESFAAGTPLTISQNALMNGELPYWWSER